MKKLFILAVISFFALSNFAFPASAQTTSDTPTLTVTGTGESKTKPDIATLNISVERKGKTASEAASVNANAAQKLIDALERTGILEKDIQTSNISINPIYKTNTGSFESESKIIGYQANNSLQVTIRKISDVGHTIDVIVLTGDYIISSVDFSLENNDAAEADALKKAVSDARRKADVVATASEKTITGIKTISVGGIGGIFPKSLGGASAESFSTPVLPGDISVSSSVSIEYTLSK